MNVAAARDVVIVRALETADGARDVWSDNDRVAASRAAAEAVGESATEDAFIGRRAAIVLERLGRRHQAFVASLRTRAPGRWLLPAVLVAAFAIGVAGVDIGAAHRINLLAPPVLALLAWNVAVYVALIVSALAGRRRASSAPGSPIRRTLAGWMRDVARTPRRPSLPAPMLAALGRFTTDWTTLAAPLWKARAATLLHFGAASLALGAIAGLYLRGIALEYRAGWQSTFLDAVDVERILRFVLAPGSWLAGLAIPGADHLRTLGAGTPGENAARWIHLYAATILLLVVVPRIVLAASAWIAKRRMEHAFPLALDAPYFRGLLRGWRQGTARIVAVAYSYDVPKSSHEALVPLLTRALQSTVDIRWLPPVAYGDDDVPALPAPRNGAVIVFNLVATPEREAHGAFAQSMAAQRAAGEPVIAIVDTSSFVERFGEAPRRLDERQQAWRRTLEGAGLEPLFIALAHPDIAGDGARIAQRLERETT